MKTNKKKLVQKKVAEKAKPVPTITHETFVEKVLSHVIKVIFPKAVRLDSTDEKTKLLTFTPEEVVVGDEEERAIRWNSDLGGYNFIIYCRHSLDVNRHIKNACNFITKDKKPARLIKIERV
jgi:hypothetical protein